MNITRPLTLLAVLSLSSGPTGFAEQDQADLKQRVLVQAQSVGADDYAFTRTIRSEPIANGRREITIAVDKYDPTKQGDARWTLVSVDGAPPSADALRKYRKETPRRRVPGYHRLAKYFGGHVFVYWPG